MKLVPGDMLRVIINDTCMWDSLTLPDHKVARLKKGDMLLLIACRPDDELWWPQRQNENVKNWTDEQLFVMNNQGIYGYVFHGEITRVKT
jgi:hypothetical protein